MSKHTLKALAIGAVAAGIGASTASAAFDTSYEAGDVIMGFQTSTADNVLEVNLGASTFYRDLNTNYFIGNVGSYLSNESNNFGGATWYSNTNLYFGAAGANVAQGTDTGVVNGDKDSTVYYTKARTIAGTVGAAASTGFGAGLSGGNPITSAASAMLQLNASFGSTQTTPGIALYADSTSAFTWDETAFNPIGGQAYGNINGGIQDQLGTGWDFTAGTFAGYQGVVAVLDLYRTNRFSQTVPSEPARSDLYQGSLVLTQTGDIFFVVSAIPEPTSAGLIGLAAVSLAALRRRRRNA